MSFSKKKDTIRIANPIYDVVFRYLMEDNLSARMFIGVILDVEVLELVLSPTENTHRLPSGEHIITVTRMDFSARIKEKDGTERLILIELQKAKYHHQIMRFRKYLGKQYQKSENVDADKKALPIFPIYILGEGFTEEAIPVIRVSREYRNATNNEIIDKKYHFIESLTHDSVVIQVKWLKQNRRSRLERFLSIFDQNAKVKNTDGHTLEINQKDFPEEFERIIRRLESAQGEPELAEAMDMEDEILAEFNLREQKLERQIKIAEEKTKLAEEKSELAEKQRKLAEEKSKLAEEKIKQIEHTILNLHKNNMAIKTIADITGLSTSEIEKIINKK